MTLNGYPSFTCNSIIKPLKEMLFNPKRLEKKKRLQENYVDKATIDCLIICYETKKTAIFCSANNIP